MKATTDNRTFALMRVIGGWILAVGSFIVAIAVTAEFFQEYQCGNDPDCSRKYLIEVTPACVN